ncbi:hypothetical protein Agub_g11949, partial [Astrephomene gubernaculifera]
SDRRTATKTDGGAPGLQSSSSATAGDDGDGSRNRGWVGGCAGNGSRNDNSRSNSSGGGGGVSEPGKPSAVRAAEVAGCSMHEIGAGSAAVVAGSGSAGAAGDRGNAAAGGGCGSGGCAGELRVESRSASLRWQHSRNMQPQRSILKKDSLPHAPHPPPCALQRLSQDTPSSHNGLTVLTPTSTGLTPTTCTAMTATTTTSTTSAPAKCWTTDVKDLSWPGTPEPPSRAPSASAGRCSDSQQTQQQQQPMQQQHEGGAEAEVEGVEGDVVVFAEVEEEEGGGGKAPGRAEAEEQCPVLRTQELPDASSTCTMDSDTGLPSAAAPWPPRAAVNQALSCSQRSRNSSGAGRHRVGKAVSFQSNLEDYDSSVEVRSTAAALAVAAAASPAAEPCALY